MKAIAYLRVSTNEQANKGVSLQAQEEKIRAYCGLYNLILTEIVKDSGISAKNLKRPGIQKIIEKVKRKEIGAIICLKLDRLTRSVKDLALLVELVNKHNVALISVQEKIDTGTASGRMVINLLATVAQWERETIGERTKTALEYKKSKGECVGNIPIGYRREGHMLVEDGNEQKALTLIRELRDRGHSYKGIAREINGLDLKPNRGNRWHTTQIARILKAA